MIKANHVTNYSTVKKSQFKIYVIYHMIKLILRSSKSSNEYIGFFRKNIGQNNVQRTANIQNIVLHDTYYKWIFITKGGGVWLNNRVILSLFQSYCLFISHEYYIPWEPKLCGER